MKKRFIIGLLVIVLALLIIIPFNIFKKQDDNNLTKVRLAEVTHSSFYTPLYVAIEKGYFIDEGLNIELLLTPGADKVSAAVLSNDVDLGFAGAESVIYVYEAGEKDYLQIVAGLTKRDGQFILSREKNTNFKLEDLYGKEILVGRKTGMPALNFLNALKKNSINENKIKINYSVEFAALSGSFIGGVGDYVNLFEPNATSLEMEKQGYVVASIGLMSDEVPYTTFYARKSYIDNNQNTISAFVKALDKGIKYTLKNSSEQVAKDIINQFPDTKVNDLALMIDRYKEYDCWLSSPFVSEKLFTNMEEFLSNFDLLNEFIPYRNLVNNFYNE